MNEITTAPTPLREKTAPQQEPREEAPVGSDASAGPETSFAGFLQQHLEPPLEGPSSGVTPAVTFLAVELDLAPPGAIEATGPASIDPEVAPCDLPPAPPLSEAIGLEVLPPSSVADPWISATPLDEPEIPRGGETPPLASQAASSDEPLSGSTEPPSLDAISPRPAAPNVSLGESPPSAPTVPSHSFRVETEVSTVPQPPIDPPKPTSEDQALSIRTADLGNGPPLPLQPLQRPSVAKTAATGPSPPAGDVASPNEEDGLASAAPASPVSRPPSATATTAPAPLASPASPSPGLPPPIAAASEPLPTTTAETPPPSDEGPLPTGPVGRPEVSAPALPPPPPASAASPTPAAPAAPAAPPTPPSSPPTPATADTPPSSTRTADSHLATFARELADDLARLRPLPGGGVSLTLEFPEAGRLDIRVHPTDGGYQVSLLSDDPALRQRLDQDRSSLGLLLARSLPEHERSVQVDVRQQQDDARHGAARDRRDTPGGQARGSSSPYDRGTEPSRGHDASASQVAPRPRSGRGLVDIVA